MECVVSAASAADPVSAAAPPFATATSRLATTATTTVRALSSAPLTRGSVMTPTPPCTGGSHGPADGSLARPPAHSRQARAGRRETSSSFTGFVPIADRMLTPRVVLGGPVATNRRARAGSRLDRARGGVAAARRRGRRLAARGGGARPGRCGRVGHRPRRLHLGPGRSRLALPLPVVRRRHRAGGRRLVVSARSGWVSAADPRAWGGGDGWVPTPLQRDIGSLPPRCAT